MPQLIVLKQTLPPQNIVFGQIYCQLSYFNINFVFILVANFFIKQRNLLVHFFRKSKREFFWSLNQKHLCDNKKFWGVVKSLISNKIVVNEKITLVEDDNIVENDENITSA